MPDSASASATDDAPQATPVAGDEPTCDLSDTDLVALVEDAENSAHAGGLETCDSHNYEWYAEAERDMQAYLQRVEQQAEAEAAEAATPPPAVAAGDDAEEEDDDFPGGDLAHDRTASFGGSWEDEPLADWQPEKILSRRRVKGATYYLVKWRSHAEPTWEHDEDLEEEGHGKTLAEFNAERRKKVAPTSASTPAEGEGKKREAAPTPQEHVLSTPFDPTIYWTGFERQICAMFEASGYGVEAIHNVCDGKRARAFTDKWATTDGVPVMLCHGTRSHLLLRIIESGLRVPNQGANPIAVLNGSVHGVGIYTSRAPNVSDWYTRGCGVMLVCAGLISGGFVGTSDISDVGNTVVFFRDDLVLPCFLVRYARHQLDTPAKYHKTLTQETLRNYLLASCGSVEAGASISWARQKYLAGCAYAAQMEKDPATVSQGGCQPGMAWTKKAKTLTKKQLRSAPRSAKEAYKQGLLLQKRG